VKPLHISYHNPTYNPQYGCTRSSNTDMICPFCVRVCEEMGTTGNTLCDIYELIQLHEKCQFLYSIAVTWKKDPTSVLKVKPVSVLVCSVTCCLLVQCTRNNSTPLSFSSTDGTHLPINFSNILPLWEIESPPSGHVWSDLPPGTPPLSCTDVCNSYSPIGW